MLVSEARVALSAIIADFQQRMSRANLSDPGILFMWQNRMSTLKNTMDALNAMDANYTIPQTQIDSFNAMVQSWYA